MIKNYKNILAGFLLTIIMVTQTSCGGVIDWFYEVGEKMPTYESTFGDGKKVHAKQKRSLPPPNEREQWHGEQE